MKVHVYGEINHPWPNYHCPACGLPVFNLDRVVLTHTESSSGFSYMIIVHEKCYYEREAIYGRT